MRIISRRFPRLAALLPRPLLICLLLACTAVGAPTRTAAQVPEQIVVSDTLHEIRLADGSMIFGRVVAVQGDRITVETASGVRVELQRAQIRSLRPVRGEIRGGEMWPEDPNTSRLFFGPTGRTVRAGEGYIGVWELFFPFLAVGVTDFITIAGGTPVFPEIIGEAFYLAPKVRILSAPRVQAAVGVLAFFATSELDEGSAGILYGAGTYGSSDNAVTAGVGWAFAGDEIRNRPAFMFGGEARVSRRVKLITENYLVTYESEEFDFSGRSRTRTKAAGLLSGVVRLFSDRLSADAGLGLFVGEGETVCCLPLVNFIYNFGSLGAGR